MCRLGRFSCLLSRPGRRCGLETSGSQGRERLVATTTQPAAQPESSSWSGRLLHGLAARVERLALRVEGSAEAKPSASGSPDLFWPYGTKAAIVSVFALWGALGALAWVMNHWL